MAVAQTELRARAVTDRDAIASFLRSDRLYAVYALGDLDGPHRRRATWGIAYDAGGRPTALAEHHEGLVPQPLFLMGDPDGCQALLETVTTALLERVPDVALNVHAGNAPAVAAYARLGYREYCPLVERLGRRRSGGWGLMRPIREAIRLTWQRDPR